MATGTTRELTYQVVYHQQRQVQASSNQQLPIWADSKVGLQCAQGGCTRQCEAPDQAESPCGPDIKTPILRMRNHGEAWGM